MMDEQEYFEKNKVAMMRKVRGYLSLYNTPVGVHGNAGFCYAIKYLKIGVDFRDRVALDFLFFYLKESFETKYELPAPIPRSSHWWAPKEVASEGSIIIPLADWYTVRIAFIDELIKREEGRGSADRTE